MWCSGFWVIFIWCCNVTYLCAHKSHPQRIGPKRSKPVILLSHRKSATGGFWTCNRYKCVTKKPFVTLKPSLHTWNQAVPHTCLMLHCGHGAEQGGALAAAGGGVTGVTTAPTLPDVCSSSSSSRTALSIAPRRVSKLCPSSDSAAVSAAARACRSCNNHPSTARFGASDSSRTSCG